MTIFEPIAIALPTLTLTDDETRLVDELISRLGRYEATNLIKEAYYDGTYRVRNLGIAIPPHLQSLEMVVGWPATTVDILNERLEWQGWTSDSGNDFGLGEIFQDNHLDIESGLGHHDALMYGTSFVVVGSGYEGEPNPLITVESARHMTGLYNARTRRLDAALAINRKENGQVKEITLYLPNANIVCEFGNGFWHVIDKDEHNLGRVLVAQMFNNPYASKKGGMSEITRPLRCYTDQAVRTMFGMEINREFYSAPQRYLLGADDDAFTTEDGSVITGWEAVMGRMLVIGENEDGKQPTVGQFQAQSPAPYVEQLKTLSIMAASEAGMPASYFGFETENPTSADAIRQAEARLIKRAEKRQLVFGRMWAEAGRLALLVRDGAIPEDFRTVGVKWRDAATPTRSAAADEAQKLIASGVLPADSEVTYDRIGLSPQEKRQLASDKRRANASQRIADIRAAVQAQPELPGPSAASEAG